MCRSTMCVRLYGLSGRWGGGGGGPKKKKEGRSSAKESF